MSNKTRAIEDEKGFSEASSSEKPAVRLAHLISVVTNPLFVALPTSLLVALYSAPDVLHALLWWVVTVVGMSVAPFLFIRRGVARGHYSDPHVSIREQRFVPLLFALGCTIIVFILLLALHASNALIATVVAVLVVGVITIVITRYWKISLHLVGMAGSVTVLVLIFGPLCLLLSPLVVLVGWARWQVRAHTLLQALAGTVLAVSVTIGMCKLFGI